MLHVIRPPEERDVAAMVKEAASDGTPLEILGAGSKRNIGRPLKTDAAISTTRLTGISLYEPSELVIAARSGTSLKLIKDTLAQNNQMLAFEPIDLGPALGQPADEGTIGAVFATNLSGSRRPVAGAARDHLIGVRAVNGNGEVFQSGGRVMKNVTGYDLCKGLSGSWGTLGIFTEVAMKVLPVPEETNTIILRGPLQELAVEALCAALASPYEVSGAVHLQSTFVSAFSDPSLARTTEAATLVRLEGFSAALPHRVAKLKEMLGHYGALEVIDNARSVKFWNEMQALRFLENSSTPVWRLSTGPQNGVPLVQTIRTHHPEVQAVFDWGGGLIWLVMPTTKDPGSFEVHRAISEFGGHATLLRADADLRAAADVFHPLEEGVQRLTKKLKDAFDPAGILNPGRMYAGV